MKKFLLSLAVLFAGTAVAQQYKAGDLNYEVEEGVEYLLSKDDMGTTFLTQDSWNYLSAVANDSAKVVFESADEQTEEGYDLYYMKFVATGEYVKDQTLVKGYDGSAMLLGKKPYIFTTTDVTEAAKWTVLLAETRYKSTVEDEDYVSNWRVWTNVGTGTDSEEDVEAGIQNKEVYDGAIVIMNAHLTKENDAPTYFEYKDGYVMFAEWGSNSWFLWTPEEMSAFEILEAYVIENLPNGVNYVTGDCPGQYDEESVNVVKAVFARYEAVSLGESDEDPLVILEDLKAAMKNVKVHEMREGYYYIQPNRQVPPGSGKAGLVFDEGGAIRAQEFARPETLTVEASKYIWYFKPAGQEAVLNTFAVNKENAYYIQNYGTSRWATSVVSNAFTGNSEQAFTTDTNFEKAAVYVFEYLSVIPGTVYIYTHQSKGECNGKDNSYADQCPYCAAWNLQNHGKHYILKWNARWDEGNMMFLYPVTQEEVDAIRDQVVQYDINERLSTLVASANESYNRGITYEPAAECTRDDDFSTHGLLYYNVDSVEVEDEATGEIVMQAQVNTNLVIKDQNGNDAVHPGDGQGLAGLLDGNAGTFCHTYWDGTAFPHYFYVDLGEGNELDAITMKMMRRTGTSEHNASFGFGEAKIWGRNSLEEEWTEAAILPMTYNINLYQHNEDGSLVTDSLGNPTLMTWASDNGENYVGIGAAPLGAKYRYICIQHYKTLSTVSGGTRENTYFSAAELALFAGAAYSKDKSLNEVVPAELKEALLAELAKAEAELAAGKGTEAQIVTLKAAYDAYLAAFPDPTRLTDALATAKNVVNNIAGAVDTTGIKGAGYYPLAAAEAYVAVIAEVEAGVKEVMPLEDINAAIAKLDAAKAALVKTLAMPEVGSYIRVRSASSNATFVDGILYARGGDDKRGIVPGFAVRSGNAEEGYTDDADIAGSISSVWFVEEVKDNTMALRNVGTGLYLQATTPVNNQYAVLNTEKAMIEVQADGLKRGGYFNFKMGVDTTSKKDLFMNTMGSYYLCGWHSAAGTDNSSFSIETVDLSTYEQGAYAVKVGEKAVTFVTLPVNAYYINTGAYAYTVAGYCAEDKKLYFAPVEDGTLIEAGTPMLVATPEEVTSIAFYQEDNIASIDALTFGYEGKAANGLVGTVFGKNIGADYGYLTGFKSIAPTENSISNGETIPYRVGAFWAYVDGKEVPVLEENPGVDASDLSTGYALDLESLDIVNAIEGVQVEAAAKGGVYTISGVRLNSAKNLPAGLYIINGKKVIK